MNMHLQARLMIFLIALLGSPSLYCQGSSEPKITVALEKDVITQHEPVLVSFRLDNPTSKEIAYELGYGYETVRVEVIDPDGRAWPKPRPAPANERLVFRQVVQAPPKAARVNSLLLTNWFNFDKLGQYQIKVDVPPSRSSSAGDVELRETLLFLTVLPRDEDSLRSACAALVSRIKSKSAADANVAAEALSNINDASAVPFLAEALKLKSFAPMMIGALARLKTPAALNAIASASRSSDPEISSMARATLVALGAAVRRQ